ncbi:MAG: EAL domain-containing protein [Sphaerochaeta sp.]|nr:EAL domain-containing protein [Sphaerochaeta sp.]
MDSYSNQNHKEIIQEKNYVISFQKMILDISFDFMDIIPENFDGKVNTLLKKIGVFFKMDRTYLFTMDLAKSTMTYSHEWCNTGVRPEVNTIEEIPLDVFPWWLDQLEKHNLVYVEDVHAMPKEASTEQEQLLRQEVQSLISVPIYLDGKIQAFIGIDSVTAKKKWKKENIELLYTMANVISNGLARINAVKKIDHMAYHDALTGLANRSLLSEKLHKGMHHAASHKTLIAIMFIDIEGVKIINDNFGHDQGDKILKQVADRLEQAAGKHDCVSRLGGDEFVIFLTDYEDEQHLESYASHVIEAFSKPFILRNQEFFITASVGISQYPMDGNTIETLIRNADIAMYKAKSLGKNHYYVCSTELKNATFETLTLTNDLYMAIKRNELMVYYQPQVNGTTGEILAVEALLRWNHPKLGIVPPNKFITLAEKTRLIIPIGYWVLKTACAQCKEWQRKGLKPINMAVNFSVHQLNHPKIVEQMENVLKQTSLQASYLEVEITESSTMDITEKTRATLQRIKDLGISLSIDDFGKEYSSLNRLKELPFDKIKLDMSFVNGIGVCSKDEKIIKAILLLAEDLKLKSIAEGVETEEQVAFLNSARCMQVQGFYFHKPMPAHELEQLLAKKPHPASRDLLH